MIILTDAKNIRSIESKVEDIKVFNFCSLLEGYDRCDILPMGDVKYVEDSTAYDISYANFLMMNDRAFMEFFKVIELVYEGNNVCMLVEFSEDFDFITEAFTKFIQQRYGLKVFYVKETDDLELLVEEGNDFNITGVYNLDIDKERYAELVVKLGIQNDK